MKRMVLMMATLGVWAALGATLPSGYTEIEYVQSSGKQYVDTGIIGRSGLEFELDVMPLNTSNDTVGMGSRNGTNGRFYVFAVASNKMRYGYADQNGASTIAVSPNVRYRGIRTVLHVGEQSISWNGQTYSRTSTTSVSTGRNMNIFSCNNNSSDSATSMRFYNIKIFEGGTPLANFVPCRRDADNLLGFYDTVRNNFYVNATATPLTSDGLVCSADGTSLIIHTGDQTVVSKYENLMGYTSLGKTGSGTLVLPGEPANAGVFTFDALTVNEGTFLLPVLPDVPKVSCCTATFGNCALNFVWGSELTSYTVSGKMMVNGTVSLKVPTTLPAGTYRLFQAGELELNGLAEFVLDESSQTGAGTTVRTLSVDATGVTLTVTGDPQVLPAGYAQVPFIKSTGCEWIDTGVDVDERAAVEMDFSDLAYVHQTALFGQDSWTGSRYLFNQQSNKLMFHGAGTDVASSVDGSARYRILIADDDKAYLTTNGERAQGVSVSRTTAALNKHLAVFGLNNGTRCTSYRFYGMKIYVAGELVRQFVPVRNAQGEYGLYDFVTRGFFSNMGPNQFFSEEGTDVFLKAIDSNGNQYVDSGVLANAGLEADLDVLVLNAGNGDAIVLGARNGGPRFYMFRLANPKCGFGYGDNNVSLFEYEPLKRMLVRSVMHVGEQSLAIDGNVVQTGTDTADVQVGKTLYFFAMHNGNSAGFGAQVRLFSAQISRGGELQGDYVPMRRADGLIGLYDRLNGVFLPNLNPGMPFTRYGIAYTLDGTTLCLHDGNLESDDIKSTYTAVRKVSNGMLNAGDQTAFPALSIESGRFSFQNAKADALTVSGTLVLRGGTSVVLDMTVDGNDCLTATALDLAGVTSENPVVLVVNPIGVTALAADETRTIVTQGLTADDAVKFKVQGFPASVEVREGALVLVKREMGAFVWQGNAADSLWSSADNWNRGEAVGSGAELHFDLPSGGTANNDVEGLAVKSVSFGSAAGAFTLGGNAEMTIQNGLVNASSATQTMEMPFLLGVAGMPFTIDTKGDLALQGGATVQTEQLVKTGAGELAIDGLALSAPSVTLAAGRTKLVDVNRGAADANSSTGTLTIAEGAQFDVNFPEELSSGDARWSSYTAGKELHVAGSGPDGTGVLVNMGKSGWCSMFTRMTLDGDTVVGGPGRIDLRNAWSPNLYKGRTWLKGPEYTFMSKVAVQHGFNFNNSDIAVRKLMAGEQGRLGLEGTTWLDVPDGVEICNGGQLDFYSSTVNGTSTVFVASGSSGNMNNYNGTSELNVPVEVQTGGQLALSGTMRFCSNVTVRTGATLLDNNGSQVIFKGPLAVEGTLEKTSGGGKVQLDGPLSGSGHVTMSIGELTFGNRFSLPTGQAPTVSYTGNYLRFGEYSESVGVPPAMPPFDTMTAEIRFHLIEDALSTDHALDDVMAQCAAAQKWVRFYTNVRSPIPILTVKDSTWDIYGLAVATGGEYGALRVGEGATLNVANGGIRMGDGGTASSRLELEAGGRINMVGSTPLRVGYDSSQTDVNRHDFVVNGGVFNSSNVILTVGYNASHAFVTQNGGQVLVKKLVLRGGDEKTAKHDECYTQFGGLLEVGSDGLTGSTNLAKHNGRPSVDFAGGTFQAAASFNPTYARIQTVFGCDLLNGGSYTFNINGQTLNWGNALAGASDVTFVGAGSFTTPLALQNMMFGTVRVPDDSTARLDLSGVSGFVGGIDLGTGASATIDISGESLVEFTILKASEFTSFDAVTNYHGFYAYTVNNMRHLHQTFSGNTPINTGYFCYRGQFYVPEDKAGQWSFAGNFDDRLWFFVDGEQVFDSASYLNVGTGTCTLAAGWHDFQIFAYDNTGGQGPQAADWKAQGFGLGFLKDPSRSGSVQAADYTPFDPSTLAMRVRPMTTGTPSGYSSMRFQHGLAASSYESASPDLIYDEIVFTSEFLDSKSVSPLNGQQMYGSNSRFTGYFKVTEEEAGEWQFDGKYDDCITVKVDGTQMLRTTSWTATGTGRRQLAAGWHSFDIRVKDGGTASGNGWGAGLTDSTGATCAVRVSVKGAATKAFNMYNFRMAATPMDAGKFERAGLGGTIRLAAGATLSNLGQMPCPVYGTLTGSGALSGAYAFTPTGAWRVKANASRLTEVADTKDVDGQMLVKNLRKVELVCTAKAECAVYPLCAAGALTDVEAAEIEVVAEAEAGSADVIVFPGWRAAVREGVLVLVNPRPSGTAIFLR